MPDVFISYSRLDNRRLDAIDYEVPNAIDRFVDVYKHEFHLSDEGIEQRFFRDDWSIRFNEGIPDAIERAIASCSVMLAFCSPAYFRSPECFAEWKEFDERRRWAEQYGLPKDRKLLLPIEVKPTSEDEFIPRPDDEDESWRWYEELVREGRRKRIITSELLIAKRGTPALAKGVKDVGRAIDEHLAVSQGESDDTRGKSNVLRVQAPIVGPTLKTDAIQAELRDARLRYSRHLPVCVIYAGGTVGMVKKESSDPVHADYEMAAGIDDIAKPLASRLAALPVDLHLFRLEKAIDSSAVTAANWVDLATLIQEQAGNYQGFVILHGTNTLAYSASALSFLLADGLTKPVILTGSEVPLSNVNTDAVHNVENAIRAAAHEAYGGPILIHEVCVYWNNYLYRGNRVTKKMASDRSSSFHCPNLAAPLATLANDKLDVDYSHVNPFPLPAPQRPNPIRDLSAVEVAILFIHPNMHFEQIDKGFDRSPDGLILLSYGPGNVPEDETFINMIERLIDDDTIVANITQCPYGRVELKLFETSAKLFDLGVIDGYDMTLEAAYTKLLWALAKYPNRESRRLEEAKDFIKGEFQMNCAGEMGASIFTQHWPSDRFTGTEERPYRESAPVDFSNKFSQLDIAEAFIRLEGMRFPEGTKQAKVRVYYGQPPRRTEGLEAEPDNLLAEFHKTLTADEQADGFDKNLEITHTFRKAFDNREFPLSIGVDGVAGVTFKSVRLVVYTKGTRHRGG